MTNDSRVRDQRLRAASASAFVRRQGAALDDARVFVARNAGELLDDETTTVVECSPVEIEIDMEEGGDFSFTAVESSAATEVFVMGDENTQVTRGDLLLARRVKGDWYAVHRPPCSSVRSASVRVTSGAAGVSGRVVRVLHRGVLVHSGTTNATGRVYFNFSYPGAHDVEVLNASAAAVVATGSFAWACDVEPGETVVNL